jgi:outer membrane receptor protein involved in Fe transport
MKRRLATMWFCYVVLVLMLSGTATLAQTITASVRGTVTDPSGAVLIGANVAATNIDTGVISHTVTNSSGLYNFQFLVIGKYTVTATAPGFETSSVGPFQLQIDEIASINPKLTIGQASSEVSVAADASILNTQNSTISTSISSQTLENMPLNGLNIQIATLFVPGSVNPNATSMGGTQGTERDAYTTHGNEPADAIPSFNGNRQQANSYILDGIDINETLNNAIGYSPSPFSIQEVHVITGNADAEFGNVNGGEVVMVTKGGTNKFHGSLFEYHEASGLTANTYANKNNLTHVPRQNYTQDQFGGAVGGPILKDKLFFFANFIALRNTIPPSAVAESVPTLAERGLAPGAPQGIADLSGVLSVDGIQLYNTSNGTAAQTPYPNNQIPIVNSVAKYIFAQSVTHPNLLPLPNHTPAPGTLTAGNYLGETASSFRNNQGDIRIDYTLNNNNTFMGKLSYGEAYDNITQTPMQVLFPTGNDYPFTNISLGWTHVFSPRIVNNARAGFTRIVLNQDITGDPSGLFGTNGDAKVGIPLSNQQIAGFTYMAVGTNDLSNFGTAYYTGAFNLDNNFDYSDTVTWVHGAHVTKIGADFVRYQQAFYAPSNLGGQLGYFNYTGNYTGASGAYGFADFLLDQAQSAQIAGVTGPFGQRQWRDAVFVQDDWKIRSNLTLNLGLRYSYDQPIYEVNNKMVNVNIPLAMFAPAGTPIQNLLEYAGQYNPATGKMNSRALYKPYYFNVMPRIGFSLSVNPRLVVRGGYGTTDELESTGTGLRMTQNPPYQPSFSQNAQSPGVTSGGTSFQVENGFVTLPGNNTNVAGSQYDAWDPNLRPAIIQQFNLTTEYLIDSHTHLQLGYVGQLGQHLAVPIWLNQYTQDLPAVCSAACLQATIPFNTLVGPGGGVIETSSRAVSNYNALQATVQRQQSNGLGLMLNYTLSKSMTNNPGYFGVDGTYASSDDLYWQDINNPRGDYGPSNFDARHSVTGTAVYELPFGHKKQFGADWNRVVDGVVGGWQVSGNLQLNTGYPMLITSGPSCSNNCPAGVDGVAHANQYLPMKIVGRGKNALGIFNWFGTDPSAVPCTSPGVHLTPCAYGKALDFGTAHVGTEVGPGFQNYDLSLLKGFRIMEGQSLKARVDAFNAFNISSYGNPNTRVSGNKASFGAITGTRSGPRTLQLSLVYQF